MIESYFQLQVNGVMAVANRTWAESIFFELADSAKRLAISQFMSFFDLDADAHLDEREFGKLSGAFQKDCPQPPSELAVYKVLLLLPLALIGLVALFILLTRHRTAFERLLYHARVCFCLKSGARQLGYKTVEAAAEIPLVSGIRRVNDKIRLEVNESILEMCQQLMAAVAQLVTASRELRDEIVAAGRGDNSPAEFCKRNRQWTEGLLSAKEAVSAATRVLVEATDGVVSGTGKLKQLIVAAQEVAASTAQLIASSRAKADRNSKKLAELARCSRQVDRCTAQLIATAKYWKAALKNPRDLGSCNEKCDKEETALQAHMLEIEEGLNREQAKLAELCEKHEQHMTALGTKENGGNGNFETAGDVLSTISLKSPFNNFQIFI